MVGSVLRDGFQRRQLFDGKVEPGVMGVMPRKLRSGSDGYASVLQTSCQVAVARKYLQYSLPLKKSRKFIHKRTIGLPVAPQHAGAFVSSSQLRGSLVHEGRKERMRILGYDSSF